MKIVIGLILYFSIHCCVLEADELPNLNEIISKQKERSGAIKNYEISFKTKYYKNLGILYDLGLSETKAQPYQTEFVQELIRWEAPRYYINRALLKSGGAFENQISYYNGKYALSGMPQDLSSLEMNLPVYVKEGNPKTLWGDSNSHPPFSFLNC